MARIRTIKPDFFTSADIVSLSMPARLLYIALWCEADREGRMVWRLDTFKLRYFPGDKINIDACARELIARRLVIEYGEGLAWIPKFNQHQHVNPREAQSVLPEPDASARVINASSPVNDAQVGREGKEGIERASSDAGFESFWASYPRKVAKRDALIAFRKLALVNGDFEKVLSGLEAAKKTEQWRRDGGKFIPHAATWLNGRRFEDEGTTVVPHEKRMVI